MLTRILSLFLILSFFNSSGQNPGRSLFLDGTTDYVIVGNDALKNISSDVTIEAYLNPCVISGKHAVVSQGSCNTSGGFYLGINNGKLEYSWSSNSGCLDNLFQSAQEVIQPKTQTHVAVVHSENSVKFYVNGNETPGILVKGSYSGVTIQAGRFLIGASEDGQEKPDSHFQGNVDEIRFWNLAKKQEDIKNNYKIALVGNETGLIAYFPMEQTAAGASVSVENKALASENVVNGITAGTTFSPRFSGAGESGCLSDSRSSVFFRGRESYIGIPHHDSLKLESGMTIEMWIKPCNLNRQLFVSKSWCAYRSGGFSFGMHPGGKLGFGWEDDGNCAPTNSYVTFDSVIVENQLVHVAVSHDSTDVKIYVNGIYIPGALVTGSFSKIIHRGNLPLLLATVRSYQGELGAFFKGNMSEFRIWNRVLDAEMIKARMHISLTGKEAGLVAYFPLTDQVNGGGGVLVNKSAVSASRMTGQSQGVQEDPLSIPLNDERCNFVDGRISQTITFPQIDGRYCTDRFYKLNATASSGLPVSYQIVDQNAPARVKGRILTFTGGPTALVQIIATQAGDNIYAPASKTTGFVVFEDPACYVGQKARDFLYTYFKSHSCNDKPFAIPDQSAADFPLKLELLSGPAALNGNMVTLQGFGGEVVIRASHEGDDRFEPLNEEIIISVDSDSCRNQPDPVVYELITTNKDGKNDFLTIENIQYYPDHTLTILNTWGEEVYKSVNYKNDWNGGQSPSGTYFYSLNIPGRKSYSGSLLLTR